MSEQEHVFVLGPPRSGTTLVKTVLQSHSDVCGVEGETWFFLRRDYAGFRHPDVSEDEMQQLVRESNSSTGLFDRFAELVKAETGAAYFLEKTPEHVLRLPYLVEHFPQSTFVFLVRDPRDGLRSAKDFSAYWATLPDEDRTGGYLETWRQSVAAYQSCDDASTVILVRYEDFCRRPKEKLSRILKRIGLRPESQQLDPNAYGTGREAKHEAHARLQEPITAESVGQWRKELTESDVRRVERTLGEEMQALGYSPEFADVA